MKRLLCVLLICLLSLPAMAETVQDQALAFIQNAGIAADSVTRIENEMIITLSGGGTARLYTYGDFDKYDLSWRFESAADEDVARYLDYALSLLATLEAKIPADTENLPASEAMRARNYAVMVSNSLLDLERVDQQGLQILLSQLAAHDDSGLNSLRARLASQLLGPLDNSPVDPAEGCAWYDALTLSVQDALPPVDASVYEADPLLAAAAQLMIAYEEERRSEYSWPQVDGNRSRNVVAINAAKVVEQQDHATIWGVMASVQYALYDGTRLQTVSGWIPHLRIEMERVNGEWTLAEVTFAEDGTRNGPSILRFCDNDRSLQKAVMSLEYPDVDTHARTWLASIGYEDIQ